MFGGKCEGNTPGTNNRNQSTFKNYSSTLNIPGQSVESLNGVNVNLQANFPATQSGAHINDC
jgi:hypothetical protein